MPRHVSCKLHIRVAGMWVHSAPADSHQRWPPSCAVCRCRQSAWPPRWNPPLTPHLQSHSTHGSFKRTQQL